MKLLFFSDPHLDNYMAFSTILPNGDNSRLVEQINVLDHMMESTKIDIVFMLGDLFNRRLSIPTSVLARTHDFFSRWADKNMFYLLVGNHDTFTTSTSDTSLCSFAEYEMIKIIDYPNVMEYDDIVITMVPYGGLLPERRTERFSILCYHGGINEAAMGPRDIRSNFDLSLKSIKKLGYDLYLFGHIHKPQVLGGNVHILGSVMSLSFAEADENKFYYVFDTETKTLTPVESGAKKFRHHIVKEVKDLEKIDTTTDYHKIEIRNRNFPIEKLATVTAPNVVVSFADSSQVSVDLTKIRTVAVEDEITAYIQGLDTKLDKDKLTTKARELYGNQNS